MSTILIRNQTHYYSKDIQKLFEACLREYRRLHFDFKFTSVNVRCIYRRTKDGFCGGYAWYNNNHVVMKLPKIKGSYGADTFEQRIARTFLHELDHCRGKSHGQMMSDKYRNVSFVVGFDIREKKEPVKKKQDVSTKQGKLMEQKKRWESKMKRFKTAIIKINRRVKYYEKRMAADCPIPSWAILNQ